jgi:Flp pilus assembly protein TadG
VKQLNQGPIYSTPFGRSVAPRTWLIGRPAARPGQGLTEFTLMLPIFLLLVMGIVSFGIVFEKKVTVDNAARAGARYAVVHPNSWSSASTAPFATIQGQVQNDKAVSIPNDGTGIQIQYYNNSDGSLCGYYGLPSGGGTLSWNGSWNGSGNNSDSACLIPYNLIKVTASVTVQMPIPIIANLFPNGIAIKSSSTMMEEQACDTNNHNNPCTTT